MTAIVSDQGSGSIFVAAFGDGMVKVFDRRMEDDEAIVQKYNAHSSWVQNVRWNPSSDKQILSAR